MSKVSFRFLCVVRRIRNAKVSRFRKPVAHARIFKAFYSGNFSRAFYFRNLKGKTKLKIFNEVVKSWLVKVFQEIFYFAFLEITFVRLAITMHICHCGFSATQTVLR